MALEPQTPGAAPAVEGTPAAAAQAANGKAAPAAQDGGGAALQHEELLQDDPLSQLHSATADRISRALVSLLTAMPAPSSPVSSPPLPSSSGITERAALMERLQSFKPTTWFAAPPALDPVACARKGWHNMGRGLLGCKLCKEQMAVSLPAVAPSEREKWDRAVGALVQGLASRHHRGCPWAHLECPRQVLAFSSEDPDAVTTGFAARVKQLLQVDYLPDVDKAAVDAMSKLYNTPVSSLTSSQHAIPPATPDGPYDFKLVLASPSSQSQWRLTKQQKAVLLALFGWSIHLLPVSLQKLRKELSTFGVSHLVGSAPASYEAHKKQQPLHNCSQTALQCQECHARIGLWQFFNTTPAAGASLQASVLDVLRRVATGTPPELLPDLSTYLSPTSVTVPQRSHSDPSGTHADGAATTPARASPFQAAASTPVSAAPARTSSGGLSGLGSPMSSTALLLTRSKSQLRSTIAGGHYISSGGALDFTSVVSPKETPFGSKRSDPVFGLAAMEKSSKRQKLDDDGGELNVSTTTSPPGVPAPGSASRPPMPYSTPAPSSVKQQLVFSSPTEGVPQMNSQTPAITLDSVDTPVISGGGLNGSRSLSGTVDLGWLACASPPLNSQHSSGQLLDPVAGHRSWCPYVCDHGSGVPGWLAVVQAMMHAAGKGAQKKEGRDALDQAKVLLTTAMRLPRAVETDNGGAV